MNFDVSPRRDLAGADPTRSHACHSRGRAGLSNHRQGKMRSARSNRIARSKSEWNGEGDEPTPQRVDDLIRLVVSHLVARNGGWNVGDEVAGAVEHGHHR